MDFNAQIELSGARSPIDLGQLHEADRQGVDSLLIGVEGYAWSRVTIDFDLGGERLVALQPGGDLEIHVQGVDPKSGAELRIRGATETTPFVALPLGSDRTIELRNLPAREFQLRGELGDWFREPLVLGEASVTVVAGQKSTVTLQLAPAPTLELATAIGRVVVPKAWDAERALITLEPLDTPLGNGDMRRSDNRKRSAIELDGFDTFEFRFDRLQAGRYELGLHKPPYSVVIDIPPGTSDGYELRVPPPVEVIVRVVDAVSGDEALGVQLSWNPARPEGVTGGGLEPATYDATSHRYTLRAPNGPIDLMVGDWRYLPHEERIDPSLGTREHTIRLEPACGIELSLRDGDTQVPLPESWWGRPEPEAGTLGESSMMTNDHGVLRVMVTAPGAYTFELPTLAGYEPSPVQRIEVRRGEFTKHVVELVREHR